MGCKTFIQMIAEDKLGQLRFRIQGVADLDPQAPGCIYARELKVPLITTAYSELYEIPGLDLIIELTGSDEIRDEIERTRPRHIRLIDHFGASLFWELQMANRHILQQKSEMREVVETERNWISQIFNNIPEEILVIDTEMVVTEANERFLQNNDVERDEAIGKYCYEIRRLHYGECQVAYDDCPFAGVMQTGETISIVRKFVDEEGNIRFLAIVSAPMFDEHGEIMGIIESTREITDRIALERSLKETEIQLRHFMESAPLATYVKNSNGVYVQVNPALCRLYGLTQSQIIGKTDLEILSRDTAENIRSSFNEVLRTGAQMSFEDELELGGRRVSISTIKYPIFNEESKVIAVCGLLKDITDLKRAELKLKETHDYLKQILDNTPVLVITTDMESLVVSVNPAAEMDLGYSSEEIVGKPVSILYHSKEEREELMRRVIADKTVREYETKLIAKDGSNVPVSLTLSQLLDSDGKMIGTVGMSKNISQRKNLMDQVMQSERLAAVGRLASGVAHEINNPLAVIGEIAGYLQELREEDPYLKKEENFKEFDAGLPKIIKQVKRCRSITHRLLSFARKSEARVEISEVNAAMNEILPFWDKDVRMGFVRFHRDYQKDLPYVRIEEMQIQEIFINIIHNSIQALRSFKSGGNIWITTRERNGKVETTIRDDGPGISEEVKGRLFDPFVTTKPTGEGTGLGLSICYGIVKRYDGQISVESEPGEGAVFTITFPVDKQTKKN